MWDGNLGDFLSAHPDYRFELVEYLESLRYTAARAAELTRFQRCLSVRPGDFWRTERQAIRQAVARVAAYQQIDWDSPRYWDLIPLIDKVSVRSDPERFLDAAEDRDQLWYRTTSGTTGPPVKVFYTPFFHFVTYGLANLKIAWLAGALTGQALARAVFGIAPADSSGLANKVFGDPDELHGIFLRPVLKVPGAGAAAELLDLARRYEPALLIMKPTVLELIVAHWPTEAAAGYRGAALVTCSASNLSGELRENSERLLGNRLCEVYGMTEFGVVSSECERRAGMHVHPRILAEVRTEDGRLRRHGRGELVLSGVANTAMPLLRYATGDLVELLSENCVCGRPGPRIASVSGRVLRNFRLPDGSEFAPNNLNRLFAAFAITEFRATQTTGRDLDLEVQFASEPADVGELIRRITEWTSDLLGGGLRIKVRPQNFTEPGKFERFRMLM